MLPPWLVQKLASPPAAGTGVHAWLFSVARQLHAHMPPETAIAVLTAATANVGRHVSAREIRDAVKNSLTVAWQPKTELTNIEPLDASGQTSDPLDSGLGPLRNSDAYQRRWPRAESRVARCRVADSAAEGVSCLSDLWDRSILRGDLSAAGWLDLLFPGAEWLCLAVDHPATARTRRREKWTADAVNRCGLIVPSPMTGPSGRGLDGRQSHRCLANTGPRRWLVIEFDNGTIDEQAALHWSLDAFAAPRHYPRLTLCVHSGGKSLHGWYGVCGAEDQTRELMNYAVSLGADPATWNRCQLVRLPGGARQSAAKHSAANARLSTPNSPVARVPAPTPSGLDADHSTPGIPRDAATPPSLTNTAPTPPLAPLPLIRQEVFYFNPTPCHSVINFSGPGAVPDSTQPRAPMES